MAQKANNKMNISYTIKALDDFTSTHQRLERQLSKIERQVQRLGTVDPDIDIDVKNGRANADIAKTKKLIDQLPFYKRIYIHVKGVQNDTTKNMGKLATNLRNIDEILLQMGQGTIWTLLPTLGPILTVAAGGAGALLAQLMAVGGAMSAFALVAVPTISYLSKMDEKVKRGSKEWYKLSSGTREALTALDKFRSSWDKMQKKFREPTLEIIASGLKAADTALKLFQPTVEGSVKAVKNLADALNENLASDDVKGIFEWLGKTAGGYLEDLVKTLGNFLVGIGNMAVAFDPLTQKFSDGFLDMSEKFRDWSSTLENNQAFQRFIDYAAEHGPTLLSFIGNLAQFLVELGISMAPIGEKVLELTNKFLEWATVMLENHSWIGKLIAGFLLFRGGLSLVTPILIQVIGVFKFLWPVISKVWSWVTKLKDIFTKITPYISKVWSWILKLGSSFLKIIPHVLRIGSTILRFATGPIGILVTSVITLAIILVKNWDKIKAWTIKTFNSMKAKISSAWDSIKAKWKVVTDLYNTLKDKFKQMVQSVRDKMNEIKQKITDKWNAAQEFLEGIDLWSIGGDIIRGLVNGISSIDVVGAVKKIGGKIKSGFTNFFGIHSPSRLMEKSVGRFISLGIIEGMTGEASTAIKAAKVISEAIRKPFEQMETEYQFSALGEARTEYAKARRTMSATETEPTKSDVAVAGMPQQAVINIGGYEARGLISYITREQDHTKARTSTFKGR